MTDDGGADRDEVRVRRAPKYSAFLTVGGGLGAVVALILTTTNTVDPEVGFLQMFLFLALFCVTFGMLFGGIAALVFDRASARRTTTVAAERSEIAAPVHQPVGEPAIDVLPDEARHPADREPDASEPDASEPVQSTGPERTAPERTAPEPTASERTAPEPTVPKPAASQPDDRTDRARPPA